MALEKINISFIRRFKLLFLVFFLLSGLHLLSAHSTSTTDGYIKTDRLDVLEKSHTGNIENKKTLLFLNAISNPVKAKNDINLSLFEIEEEDDFSFSNKGFKSYQQISSVFVKRLVECTHSGHKLISRNLPHSATKLPLYTSYQVFRI